MDVDRPHHRQAAPPDERRERPGDGAELARSVVAAEERPGERDGQPRDHAVEREQEVHLVVADVDRQAKRDAGEGREREEVRPAPEDERDDDREDETADRGRRELRATQVRQQRDAEHAQPGPPGDEPGEPCGSGRREVHRDEAGAPDDGRDLRGRVHGAAFRTTTTARFTWPFASTRST